MERYINSFATENDIQIALQNGELLKPYVAYIEDVDRIDWNSKDKVDYATEYLTFNITSNGNINVPTGTTYSINGAEWENTGRTITVNSGETIRFKGNNSTYKNNTFSGSTAGFEIEGNIMSLVNSKNFATLTTLESDYTFSYLFDNCTGLTSAENLILPATTLAKNCYQYMFQNCTSLTNAPALPATTLAQRCYEYMFQNCTSLTAAPALPATNLASICYSNMFDGCTSLTTAPKELPAKTLATFCYNKMFQGCTSLTTAPALPATTLVIYCYNSMFRGCTSLTTAPALPATTLVNYCYQYMFYNCKSLTTAPELPATTLATQCYSSMFEGCTSLTTAPELPATTLADSCYSSMFYGTNVLPDCSNIDFASSTVVASGGLQGLFAGTKVTDNDLEILLPKNDNGKYYLPATTLADSCYSSMFEGCTSLTSAPELPATMLTRQCYFTMFNGCSNLNFIKCLATNLSFLTTDGWVQGVASTGTFVKAASMAGWTTGINGIPEGWTVQDA